MMVDRERQASGDSAAILLSVVLGVAGVGYGIGLRQTATSKPNLPEEISVITRDPGVPPSMTYTQMRETRVGPNAKRRDVVEPNLVTTDPHRIDPKWGKAKAAPSSLPEKKQAAESRAMRRAYSGAPPVIPHTVDSRSSASCKTCHQNGLVLGDRIAPAMPHDEFSECMQCHVAQSMADEWASAARFSDDNSFRGLSSPVEGDRAYSGAPPLIPHSTQMRSNCLSCHGPLGQLGLRTTHPERQSCTQCHAPSAALERLEWSEPGAVWSESPK